MSCPGVVTEAAQGYAAPPMWARQGGDRPRRAPAHPVGAGVGDSRWTCDTTIRATTSSRCSVRRTLGDGKSLVFPMRSGKPISLSTLPKMLQFHGFAAGGARLPLVGPGLGGGGDRPSTRGHRGGAGPRRSEHGRGRLCPRRPVRAAADRRLGGVCRSARITGSVDRAAARQTVIGTTASRVRSSDRSATLSSTTPPRTG